MKKIIFSVLFALLLAPVSLRAADLVEVGNKICPLSADKVSGKHFVEYHGRRYGMCCSMCVKKFNKNPGGFVSDLQAVEAGESKAMTHEHAGH